MESHPSGAPRPRGAELTVSAQKILARNEPLSGFSAQLSWSHYCALMRVEHQKARDFCEREAVVGGWDKRTLERQIQSF